MMRRPSIILACLVVLLTAEEAAAQFRVIRNPGRPEWRRPPTRWVGFAPPPAFFPFGPYGGADPFGGYLSGAANVINAQGQYLIQNQQANLLREQVRNAQIDNRRRTFDEWLYERQNLPSLNEQRELSRQEAIRRSLNTAPLTEIWSGTALNDILSRIQQLGNLGYEGPTVPLNPEVVSNINVTTGAGSGNAGLLHELPKLNWPIGLQLVPDSDDLRKQINTLLNEAVKQVSAGRINAATINDLNQSISQLRAKLVGQAGNFNFQTYTPAMRYIRELNAAVALLQRPDAGQFVSGQLSAQGGTVRELIDHMLTNGLRFAPAVSGQEAAYSALYNAMVTYTVGASADLAYRADPRGTALFPKIIEPNPR